MWKCVPRMPEYGLRTGRALERAFYSKVTIIINMRVVCYLTKAYSNRLVDQIAIRTKCSNLTMSTVIFILI